jgi:dipeptidyl-peptidase-4
MKPIMLEQSASDAWINLHNMFYPLKKTDEFLWASERSGYQHLYLYNYAGHVVRQLTDGELETELD